jgi:paraquat-inducible protein B
MTESRDTPRGGRRWRDRWPGLVWAVPLAALLVVGYLAVQAWAQQGVDVVVTFDSAFGARAGDTPVVYKGVRIGRVTKIEISRDARHVDMTLRLVPQTRDALREGATFWMIGAEPSLTDLSSLTAVVSGVSIGASPGSGAPRRRFVGQDSPPPVPPGQPGSAYFLDGPGLGGARLGAGVYYGGLEVGRVTHIALGDTTGFRLTVFVRAPFDLLVKPDTRFFAAQGLDVELTRSGLGARLGPGNSVLAGGVEFETPPEAQGEPKSASGATFRFYAQQDDAELGPVGPEVAYQARLPDGGGRLQPGALVTLNDFPIGRVLGRRLAVDAARGLAIASVQVAIAPERLGLADRLARGEALSPADWRRRTDRLLDQLVRKGYRLQLAQNPPALGPQSLALVRMDSPPAGDRVDAGWLPAAPAPSLSGLVARADAVLREAQAVPLADIGRNLRQLTGRLNGLVGSPEVASSLAHLNATLVSLDRITSDVAPKAGPLAAKLTEAATQLEQAAAAAKRALGGPGAPQDANVPDTLRQLNVAARALRTLADDLDRHPEAVLTGKPPSP